MKIARPAISTVYTDMLKKAKDRLRDHSFWLWDEFTQPNLHLFDMSACVLQLHPQFFYDDARGIKQSYLTLSSTSHDKVVSQKPGLRLAVKIGYLSMYTQLLKDPIKPLEHYLLKS